MRIATSKPSSTMFTTRSSSTRSMLTAACLATKRFTVGATYICPNSTGAVMRKCPLGSHIGAHAGRHPVPRQGPAERR